MQTVTVQPSAFRPEVIDSIRMVGRIATVGYHQEQVKIHSVEGPDFYAFVSDYDTGTITIDFEMTRGYRSRVYAYVIPAQGERDGGYEVPLEWIKLGVCLFK